MYADLDVVPAFLRKGDFSSRV